jgi:transposase
MRKFSTQEFLVEGGVAGIDIGKDNLDIAIGGLAKVLRRGNDGAGHAATIGLLRQHGVTRVGMEATGGYERALRTALADAGFEVMVFQPKQVRAYAIYRLQRAKSDSIDAMLIARCTAERASPRPRDARLDSLCEHLTFIEQIEEDLARAKVRGEHLIDPRLIADQKAEILRLKARRKAELALLVQSVRQHADLAHRLELLQSIDGIGERTAIALVLRMPELGSLTREEAASLLGVAPFVQQSGRYKGQTRTGGGRSRARTSLFAAAQAACRRWNKALVLLYDRLKMAGKPHAVAVIACTRKLIIYANTVLNRDRPWKTQKA